VGSGGASAATEEIVMEAESALDEGYEKLDKMEQELYDEGDFYGAGSIAAASGLQLSDMPSDVSAVNSGLSSDIAASDVEALDMEEMTEDLDEAYEMLDEMMEDLGVLEVVDPHMDEQGLKDLRIRHRHSEEKDMTKADMDYLKSIFDKYQKDMVRAKSGAFGISPGATAMSYFMTNPAAAESTVSFEPVVDVLV
jgi:hypothetical protein